MNKLQQKFQKDIKDLYIINARLEYELRNNLTNNADLLRAIDNIKYLIDHLERIR